MEAFHTALSGEDAGLVSGLTWVSPEALGALVGASAEDMEVSLVAVARAINLDFLFIPADQPWSIGAVGLLHEADVAVVWTVSGVFGRMASKVGWPEALRMTAGNPAALTGALAEALHGTLAEMREGFSAGVDAVLVADDLAGATGPLVAPDFALDALLPCYHHAALAAAGAGVPALFHSDGDIRVLMPALARAGFAGIHLAGLTADALVTSHAAARSEGLIVLGGIDAASLAHGARRAGSQAAHLAHGGGMLVCDDGGITTAEEVTAFAAALLVARDVHDAERSV